MKVCKEVSDILRGDFYVDDLLKSVQDEETAIERYDCNVCRRRVSAYKVCE